MKIKTIFTTFICLLIMAFVFISPASAFGPIGYPYSSWGQISFVDGAEPDEDFAVGAYVEQGIDWVKFNNTWTLNTFAGLGINWNSIEDHYWDNKTIPTVGVKISHPLNLGQWGVIGFGIKEEFYKYFSSSKTDDQSRTVVFVEWSFGGDWKKSK